MKRADALKKWKKDKPILLTDTGVSDVLRKLPEDWTTPIDISEVDAVLKELKQMMAAKKISESKSATASLTAIRKEVKEYRAIVANNRAQGIEIMKGIHECAKERHAMCESKKISLAKLKSYPGDVSKLRQDMDKIQARGQDSSAIPFKIVAEFRGSLDCTIATAKQMAEIVEDAMSEKPKRDMQKELPIELKKFKEQMDEMPSAWKAAERLT